MGRGVDGVSRARMNETTRLDRRSTYLAGSESLKACRTATRVRRGSLDSTRKSSLKLVVSLETVEGDAGAAAGAAGAKFEGGSSMMMPKR